MYKSLTVISIYFLGSLFSLSAAQNTGLKITEKIVNHIGKNRTSNFIVSENGMRVAYVIGAGKYNEEMSPNEAWERYQVVVDGKKGKAYPRISEVQFSPDSKRVGYIAGHVVVIDDKQDQTFGPNATEASDQQIGELFGLRFSPDSRSYVYTTASTNADGPAFVVLNGTKLQSYARVHNPIFSPNSKHLAYSAQLSNPRREFTVLDGKEGPTFDHLIEDDNLKFSPDSSKLSYLGWSENNKQAQYIIDQNGSERLRLPAGEKWRTFSPDSQHIAYVSQTGRSIKTVLIDGRNAHSFDAWSISPPIFSQDSQRMAFVVLTKDPTKGNGQGYVVLDGKKSKIYRAILLQEPIFSPNSQHFAFGANDGTSWFAVIDGREIGGYNSVRDLQFNPSDSSLEFIAQIGDKFCVNYRGVNGKLFDQITELRFSNDGKNLAYVALDSKSKKWQVVLNEQASAPFDLVIAKGVYDTRVSNTLSHNSLHFIANNQLQFLAMRGDRLISVRLEIQ